MEYIKINCNNTFDPANFTSELKNFSTDELEKICKELKSQLGQMSYNPNLITKIMLVEDELEKRWQD